MGVESSGVNSERLLGGFEQAPKGSGLVNAEGFQVSKVGCASFAHGVAILSSGSNCLLSLGTMCSTSDVQVVQGLVAAAVIPWSHGFVGFIRVGRATGRLPVDIKGRTLEGSAQG